jgi:hypothetical protein
MAKRVKLPEKYQVWIDARKRYRLSHVHIQMARELSMNPRKFGKIADHKQEPWKGPLPVFIKHLYYKRFGKARPDEVKSVEQLVREREEKRAKRRELRQLKKQNIGNK